MRVYVNMVILAVQFSSRESLNKKCKYLHDNDSKLLCHPVTSEEVNNRTISLSQNALFYGIFQSPRKRLWVDGNERKGRRTKFGNRRLSFPVVLTESLEQVN